MENVLAQRDKKSDNGKCTRTVEKMFWTCRERTHWAGPIEKGNTGKCTGPVESGNIGKCTGTVERGNIGKCTGTVEREETLGNVLGL